MARINIEDKWFLDPRRDVLIALLNGDSEKADGAVIAAWRLAQQFYLKGEALPKHRFDLLKSAGALIEAQLAVVENGSIKVCGTQESFDWIKKKQLAGSMGGKKSAQSRLEQTGTSQPSRSTPEADPKQNEALVETPEAPPEAPSKQNEPSYSSSDSSSNSGSSSLNILSEKKGKKQPGIRTEYPSEFDSLWTLYGKKGEKKEAYDQYLKLNLSPEEREQLAKAIPLYFKTVSEEKYKKDFSRFLKADWREYLALRSEVLNFEQFNRKSKTQEQWERNKAVLQAELDRAEEEKSQGVIL